MILSPYYDMNIVQDFSLVVSTNVKQQILEPLLTVLPNTSWRSSIRNFKYSIFTECKTVSNHTTLQTSIQANGTIVVASALSWLSVKNIL